MMPSEFSCLACKMQKKSLSSKLDFDCYVSCSYSFITFHILMLLKNGCVRQTLGRLAEPSPLPPALPGHMTQFCPMRIQLEVVEFPSSGNVLLSCHKLCSFPFSTSCPGCGCNQLYQQPLTKRERPRRCIDFSSDHTELLNPHSRSSCSSLNL